MIRREKKRLIRKIKEYEENLEYWEGGVERKRQFANEMRSIGGPRDQFVEHAENQLKQYEDEIANHNRLIKKLKKRLYLLENN